MHYFFGSHFTNLHQCFDFFLTLCCCPLNLVFIANAHLLTFLHSKQGYLPDDFSCKNLYRLVLELPSYSPHSSSFWAASYKRLINRWATLWHKSGLKLIEKKKTDVLKLIIYHTIRVRYILKTWGYKNETDKCALYFQVKTIEHCFCFALVCTLRGIFLHPTCPIFPIVLFLSALPLFSFPFLVTPLLLLFHFIVTQLLRFCFGSGKLEI